jgi:hypothetical protein
MLRPGHGGSGASCRVRTAAPAAGDVADGLPRRPSAVPGERERRRLVPQDLRGRDRRDGHGRDLDVGAGLISVDLQEHVADAQGRALATATATGRGQREGQGNPARRHGAGCAPPCTRTAGVRHLFAAYELGQDKLSGHITPQPRKTPARFLESCRCLRSLYPPEVRIAIVCDNCEDRT